MVLGMSQEEFWFGEPRLAVAYREAEKMRRENLYFAEWRQGRYVYEALLAASPAFRELSKGIEHEYPQQPLFSNLLDQEALEEQRERARFEKMMKLFEARAASINDKLREGED